MGSGFRVRGFKISGLRAYRAQSLGLMVQSLGLGFGLGVVLGGVGAKVFEELA